MFALPAFFALNVGCVVVSALPTRWDLGAPPRTHIHPQSAESEASTLIVVASVIGLAFSAFQFMLIASVK